MRRRSTGASFLLVALALVAAGCGGGDGGGEDEAAAPTTTAAPAATQGQSTPSTSAPSTSAPSTTAAPQQAGGSAGSGGTPAGTSACPDKGGALIGFSAPLPDPNFQLLLGVVTDDAQKAGHRVTSTVANLDPGKQISDVQTMLQQGIDVLVVAPVDPNALTPAVQQAKAKNVPIITLDDQIPGSATTVKSQAFEGGKSAARYIAERLGGGKVAALEGPTFSGVLRERNAGFTEGAKEAGLDVVDKKTNLQITPDGARQITEAWRTSYGADLKAIWTFNDVSALGAASGLSGSFRPAIVSMNGEPAAVDAVRNGAVAATFDLQPIEIGHTLSYAADQAYCAKPLPERINVEMAVVDRSNVASWQPWDEQRKKPFSVRLQEKDGQTFLVTEESG